MRTFQIPACPPNHRRRNTNEPMSAIPSEEDWMEWGIAFDKSLTELSSWMDDQMDTLKLHLSVVLRHLERENGQNANQIHVAAPSLQSLLEQPGNDQQISMVRQGNIPRATGQATQATVAIPALPCLYPIETKSWWNDTRKHLASLVPKQPRSAPQFVSPPVENASLRNRAKRYRRQRRRVEEVRSDNSDPEDTVTPSPPIDEENPTEAEYIVYLRDIGVTFGTDGQLNLELLNYLVAMLNVYYSDHVLVGAHRWNEIFSHKNGSRTSYRHMMFLVIMQARLLRGLFVEIYEPYLERRILNMSSHGVAFKQLQVDNTKFNLLITQQLALPKSIPIAAYKQSEIEQALTILLFRARRSPWTSQLHHFTHALFDRMAAFFYFPMSGNILDLKEDRSPLPATLLQPGGSSSLFNYNLRYQFRCSWRYFYLMQNVLTFEHFMDAVELNHLAWDVNLAPQAVRVPKELSVDNIQVDRADIKRLGNIIKKQITTIFDRYSHTELDSMNTIVRKAIMEMVLPQGDLELVAFEHPSINVNPHNVMEKLHKTFYAALRLELFPAEGPKVLSYYLKQAASPQHPLHFLHNYLVLFMFDKHAVYDMQKLDFLKQKVIPQRNIHFYAKQLFNAREPYIREWAGSYYLFFDGRMSFEPTASIYDILAEWALVAYKYCPDLWEEIQRFCHQLLPPVLLTQNNRQLVMDAVPPSIPTGDAMDIDAPPPSAVVRVPMEQGDIDISRQKTLLIL